METPNDVDLIPSPVRVSVFDLAALDLTGSSPAVDPSTPAGPEPVDAPRPATAPASVDPTSADALPDTAAFDVAAYLASTEAGSVHVEPTVAESVPVDVVGVGGGYVAPTMAGEVHVEPTLADVDAAAAAVESVGYGAPTTAEPAYDGSVYAEPVHGASVFADSVYVEPITQPEAVVATAAVAVGSAPILPGGRSRRRARRRSRVAVGLAAVLAVGLVGVGVGAYALTHQDDNGVVVVPPASAAPTAGAAAAGQGAPADDQAATAPPAAADQPDAGAPAADDPAAGADAAAGDLGRAVTAVQSFLGARGTDAERTFSSQGGRDQVDAVVADLGQAVVQGDPTCRAVGPASFSCVQDTDQAPITFTVGPDPDDPATSGFEVVGASAG